MIGFCVGDLGLSLYETLSMSWAEFVLRQRGFLRNREFQVRMFREVAYEVHGLKYMFGKKKPPSKNKFWPIDKEPKSMVSDAAKEAFLRQLYKYKEKVKDNGQSTT